LGTRKTAVIPAEPEARAGTQVRDFSVYSKLKQLVNAKDNILESISIQSALIKL